MKRILFAGTGVASLLVGMLALAVPPAYAAPNIAGSQTLAVQAGTLFVSNTTPATITAPVDGSGSGALPSARWGDLTGSGAGWQGSIAATNFVYTGNWTPLNSAPALLSDTSANYTGTADGDTYTVQVTGVSGSTIDFSYTSTNGASGTGSGTAGTATSVGTHGLTITFASSSTYSSGNSYQIQVGTQNPSALILNNSSSSATISPYNSSTSTPPTFVNSTATLTGGGTTYGTAVPYLSANPNTGMGEYTVSPQATVTTDLNSWAATYTSNIQYTIASGPATATTSTTTAPVATSSAYQQSVLADNAVGYWPLGGDSGTASNLATGTAAQPALTYSGGLSVGAPATGALGGSSTVFNGTTGYVSATSPYSVSGNYTVAGWVKVNALPTSAGSDPYPFSTFFYYGYSGVGIRNGGCLSPATECLAVAYDGVSWQPTSYVLPVGSWMFIAMTMTSSGTAEIYVNGNPAASVSSTIDSGTLVSLGSSVSAGINQRFLNGSEAQVAYFNDMLSATQIETLYEDGSPSPTNLTATVALPNVDLSWNAPPNTTGITGYTVSRNGVQIATLSGATTTSYVDTSPPANTAVTYTVATTTSTGSSLPVSTTVFVGNAYGQAVVTDGAVGYWQLGGDSGTATNLAATGSMTQPSLTYSGGVSIGSAPNSTLGGSSSVFNGTSGYASATSPYSVGGNYTVAGWVKVNALPTSAGADPYPFSTFFYYGDVGVGIRNGGCSGSVTECLTVIYDGVSWDPTSYAPPIGSWMFVAMTMTSSGGAELYVNGTQVAAVSSGINSGTATSIASSQGARYLNGAEAQVAYFNSVLSASQISDLYTAGS